MTTLNNDELREAWRGLRAALIAVSHYLQTPYSNDPRTPWEHLILPATERLDYQIKTSIATHDQQLLEAILEGAIPIWPYYTSAENPSTTAPNVIMVMAVPVEHIKSVFNKEGE